MLICSLVSDSLRHHGIIRFHGTIRFLCPWDFAGKNTGLGCHFLLQESSRPRDWTLVSCIRQVGSLPLSHQVSPDLWIASPLKSHPCVRKTLWMRKWQPTSVFLPGKSSTHGDPRVQYDWVTKHASSLCCSAPSFSAFLHLSDSLWYLETLKLFSDLTNLSSFSFYFPEDPIDL